MTIYLDAKFPHSEIVKQLAQWSLSKKRTQSPDRSDFDPSEFKALLPNILISDVEADPFRLRCRLAGTRVTEATGVNMTGRYLDEVLSTEADGSWMKIYYTAYCNRCPVVGRFKALTTSGGYSEYGFGIFPVRKGGTAIEQFIAIEDYADLVSTLVQGGATR